VSTFFSLNTEDSKISKKNRQTNHTTNNLNRRDEMYGSQIERLKKDSRELKHYIRRIEKEGNELLAYKLQKKYQYLNSRITDIEEAFQTC
jgi:predicted RNase H-like nuclease (RuvC/YqgF family)